MKTLQELFLEQQRLVRRLAKVNRQIKAAAMHTDSPQRPEKSPEDLIAAAGFSEMADKLLTALVCSRSLKLSKEDIRQDICLDEFASDNAIHQLISRVRAEMQEKHFPFVIESIPRFGYRLSRV